MNVNEGLKFLWKWKKKTSGGGGGVWVGGGEVAGWRGSGWISEVFVKIKKKKSGGGGLGVRGGGSGLVVVRVDVNEELKFL